MKSENLVKHIFARQSHPVTINESEIEKYTKICTQLFDIVVLTSKNLVINKISSKSHQFIKVNKNLIDFIKPAFQGIIHSHLQKIQLSNNAATLNLQFINSDDWYRANLIVAYNGKKEVFFIWLFNNNQEIHNLNEKLKNAEDRFKTIVETTHSWENWINPQGDLIYVNPAIEKFTGYSFNESVWLFQHPEKYIHKEDFKRVVRRFNQSLAEELPGDDVFRIIKKDKSILWVSSKWDTVYSSEGKYLGIRSSLHDISNIMEKQFLLEENYKIQKKKLADLEQNINNLSKINSIQKNYVSGLNHLVRTQLNAIMGFTEQLYTCNLDPEEIKIVEIIEEASENILSVVKDLVDLQKIESKSLLLELKVCKAYEVIQKVVQIVKPYAQQKNLSFNFQYPDELKDIFISTDTKRLSQILINILNTSIKFTLKGSVSLTVLNEFNYENEIGILFKITDTGIGFSEESIEAILSESFDTEKLKLFSHSGSGIGLFIANQLIKLLGGKLIISKLADEGSEFKLHFNFKKSKEGKEGRNIIDKLGSINSDSIKDIKILLVEDQAFNQLLITKIVEIWKCKLVIANDGNEAIEYLKKDNFNIVLMDIQLPKMSGIEITKYIRKQLPEPANSIPIIALTANVIEGDKEKYLRAGMNDYLPKPFKSKDLFEIIEQNLKNRV